MQQQLIYRPERPRRSNDQRASMCIQYGRFALSQTISTVRKAKSAPRLGVYCTEHGEVNFKNQLQKAILS